MVENLENQRKKNTCSYQIVFVLMILFVMLIIPAESAYCIKYQFQNCTRSQCQSCDYYSLETCCSCIWGYYFRQTNTTCYRFQGNCGLNSNKTQLYWNHRTNTCNTTCIDGYKNPQENKCVQQCPYNMQQQYKQTNATNSSYQYICTFRCPQGQFYGFYSYGNNYVSGNCLSSCKSNGYNYSAQYGNIFTRTCINNTQCPIDPLYNEQMFGDNISSICVNKCPDGSYGHMESKLCVRRCYGKYQYKNQLLNLCTEENNNDLMAYLIKVEQKLPNITKDNSTVPIPDQPIKPIDNQSAIQKLFKSPIFVVSAIAILLSLVAFTLILLLFIYYHCNIKPKLQLMQQLMSAQNNPQNNKKQNKSAGHTVRRVKNNVNKNLVLKAPRNIDNMIEMTEINIEIPQNNVVNNSQRVDVPSYF